MADDYAGDRYWTLVPADVSDVIRAVNVPVIIRKIVLYPKAASDVAVIQEYDSTGTVRTAMRIKAGTANADLVALDWGPRGRKSNGFVLASLSTSAALDVYVGAN